MSNEFSKPSNSFITFGIMIFFGYEFRPKANVAWTTKITENKEEKRDRVKTNSVHQFYKLILTILATHLYKEIERCIWSEGLFIDVQTCCWHWCWSWWACYSFSFRYNAHPANRLHCVYDFCLEDGRTMDKANYAICFISFLLFNSARFGLVWLCCLL